MNKNQVINMLNMDVKFKRKRFRIKRKEQKLIYDFIYVLYFYQFFLYKISLFNLN